MSEYSISTDYLNILNSKVNNLYDFVKKNHETNEVVNSSVNSISKKNNMISCVKVCVIMGIFFILGYFIYKYLDNNHFFDSKPQVTEKVTEEQITETTTKVPINNHDINTLKQKVKKIDKKTVTFEEDTTDNNVQNNKKHKKGKFCYLGSDRGFRSCIKLQENQECESQKLYPTMEMCVNPELRYT